MTEAAHRQRADINEEALPFLRRRIVDMLPARRVTAKLIAENIAFGAAVLGAGHIELVDDGPWWFIASEFNWLGASKAAESEVELFERLVPFPEQSPTGHRAEIYVTAFADHAYFRIGDVVTWIRGEPIADGLPDAGVTPPWCSNVLAFRMA
ncbi:MAG: hypothetical protein OXH15_01120 [Gammaproteobacteria bacterium]|nr:hypothetical protein [Gammaproteobacteria bacterium]